MKKNHVTISDMFVHCMSVERADTNPKQKMQNCVRYGYNLLT
jgi:hypothetical protein